MDSNVDTPPSEPRHRRRWPRRLLFALLGLLLLLVLIIGGALLYVNTSAGERRIREMVVEAANNSIQGKLGWEALDIQGDRFVFKGLKLYDPEGVLVAEIDTVELELAFRALVQRRFIVREARIFRPRLYLIQDDRGLNLTRAIASRNPSTEEEAEKQGGEVFLKLDKLTLEEGYVDLEQHGEERDLHVRIEDLGATGDATYATAGQKIEANLGITGRTVHPVEGPLSTKAHVKLEGMNGGGDLRIELPGALVDLHGDLKGLAEAHLDLRAVELAPATAKAFLPSYPLTSKVAVSGKADKVGNLARFDLDGTVASGTLKLKGGVDVETLRSPGVTLTARGLNLATALEDAPQTDLALDLEAKGGGSSLETLDAEVKLNVPPSKLSGETLGPIRLQASAKDGTFHVPTLEAILPGVKLNASGKGTPETLSAKGNLQVSDLARLAKSLGRLGQRELPSLSGNGQLAFQVQGPAKTPGVILDGDFPSLRYGEYVVRNLSLDANLPDVSRPLDSEGRLQVAYLELGERVFRQVDATVQSRGQEFRLDARAGGALDLRITAVGLREDDSRALALSELTLTYPEASWKLMQPAHLAFREDLLSAEGLVLQADQQRLALDAEQVGERFDAKIGLTQFDLGRLPRIAVEPSLGLAGIVDADITAKGTAKRPTAQATVRLSNGAFKEYKNLAFALDATYAKDRATGKARADSDIADLSADFDVPIQGLLRRRNEPVSLSVTVEDTEVQDALKALGRPETGQGKVGANLVVTGSARDPVLALRVTGRNVRVADYPPPALENPDFDLRIESALEDRVQARIDLAAAGVAGRVDLRTPWTLGSVIQKPPTPEVAMKTPIELDVALHRVPLAILEAAGLPKLDGTAVVRAEVRGAATAPTVNAQIDFAGAGMPGAPAHEGAITLVATDERVDFGVEARRGDRKQLELAGGIAAPLAQLMEPDQLGDVALRLRGVLHPLSLAELQGTAPGEAEEGSEAKPSATGLVLAKFDATGTLNAPVLSLRGNLEQVRYGQACIGRAALAFDYAASKSELKVDLTSTGEGRLQLDATAELPLGLAAVQRGLDYETAPLQANLQARNFELASFTGLIPKVRAISGLLEANAKVAGTMKAPSIDGTVQWKNGSVALEGYGDYTDTHVRIVASNDRVQVQEFRARSGAGNLQLTADAQRQGRSGTFALKGELESHKFPLVVDDELMAWLTSKVQLQGDVSTSLVNIKNLAIPEATVDLPDLFGGKSLQELDRPEDVVLVRNGRPLKKRKTPQEAASQVQPGTGGSAAPGASAAAAAQDAATKFWIRINAPRNLWVKGADINAELGLSDDFRFEYENVSQMYGEVRVLRGTIDALGRKFTVQRSSMVRFTGPPKVPYLNVTAIHENEREEVVVTVSITGQGKESSLKVSSQPPLPETEIYTLLATGRRTLKRGSGASMNTGDAASIVGALAASTLKRTLANKLPLDVFTIESTGDGLTGARVEAGTYITDKWYMGYTGRLGGAEEGENTYGVRVEYQVSPNVSVEGEYGDQRKGADLIWSRDY